MHLIRLYIPRTLALLALLFLTTASSFAIEKLVPSLSLTIDGEKILNGSCINGSRDFSKTKFRIVDQNGNGLSYFEIVKGNLVASHGDPALNGEILETGLLDETAIKLLKNTSGDRVTAFVKLLDKSNNTIIALTFQFHINVIPTIVFGNITQAQEDVDLDMLTSMESLGVEFSENLKLIKFKVVSGVISVDGLKRPGKILENGILNDDAIKILAQSAGKQVTVLVLYSDPAGVEKKTALVFQVADV